MPVATITVAFVNPPKGAAKSGSIKTEAGDYFRVWQDKLALFSQGWKGTIEYTDESWNGKDYRQFRRIVDGATSPTRLEGRANGKATGNSPNSDQKSCEMFIMAIMGKAWEGTGKLPSAEEARQYIVDLRWAWENAWKFPVPNVEPDVPQIELNDEIPF